MHLRAPLSLAAYLSWVMSATSLLAPSVGTFLKASKLHLKDPLTKKCVVVLGNQASDADSIVSSLCYAKFLQERNTDGATVHIPSTLMPRTDLVFRREVQLLLNTVDIDLSDLVCVEDIPLNKLHEMKSLSLVLSDHNSLESKLEPLSDSIVEIIDHHADCGQYQWVKDSNRNIAFDAETKKALVGSTCTLVAEKYFESCTLMCSEVATLLMGVIALDTINMDPHAGIGTERDSAALARLGAISTHSQDHLFRMLRDAKLDPEFWRQLSVDDVLRIDYKSFHSPSMSAKSVKTLGIAAALMPLGSFLTKEAMYESARKTMKDQDLSLLVVMTFVHQPAPHRELLVIADQSHGALFEAVTQFLLDSTQHTLNCSILPEENDLARTAFQAPGGGPAGSGVLSMALKQGDAKASRKQVAPLLTAFLGKGL